MKHIAIVGGGISGLTAAYRLRRQGYEVTVLESEEKAGGKVRAERRQGFLIEHGPNGWLADRKEVGALVEELGLTSKILRPAEAFKKRFLALDTKDLLPLPQDPLSLLKSPILSRSAKLRLLMEPFAPKRPQGVEETLADFGRRRLGREVTEKLVDALQTGIYAGDIEKISFPACFPMIAEMEERHGSLLGAMRKMARGPRVDRSLLSFPEGMAELTGALARVLGSSLKTRRRVLAWRHEGEKVCLAIEGPDGRGELLADALILTTPARIQADLLTLHDAVLADQIRRTPYVSLSVVTLGYRRTDVRHPLDGFGFICPKISGRSLLGVIFSSTLFSGRAPSGRVLLRCLLGGARDPGHTTRSNEEVISTCRAELEYLVKIAAEPEFVSVVRHDEAIPQYYVGHQKRVEEIEARAARIKGLFLGGNAYHGVALHDCVRDADRLSALVRASFSEKT